MTRVVPLRDGIVLRPATVRDAAAIASVRVASWRATYRGVIPDAYLDAMEVGDSTELWAKILSTAPSKLVAVYVAESADGVMGFASGNLLSEPKFGLDAELGAVYLMPQVQRSGIGRRLVAMVANTLAARDATGLIVWVIADNKPARRFYEQLGAELLIEQPFSWDGHDLIEAGYAWRNLQALTAACGE